MDISVKRSSLGGSLSVPGSKSHTIRAVLLATMAEGASTIRNPLTSLDGMSALNAARTFGAEVVEEPGKWTVRGLAGKLHAPANYLDCGNSGSVAYFATPMAATIDDYTFVTGDAQIRRRPIDTTVSGINQLGGFAAHTLKGSVACPVIVHGIMRGGTARLPGKLSQMISGFMMAAPLLEGDTEILVDNPSETPYIDITIDWMRRFGVELEHAADYSRFALRGRQGYRTVDAMIPADWSAAAFPLVAALVTGGKLIVDGVDFNDCQGDKAVVDYLAEMGADIVRDTEGGRLVIHGGRLTGGRTIDMSNTPDALPAMSVAAAFAEGDTRFTGLTTVRLKETDRVSVMAEELGKLGVSVDYDADSMTVHGGAAMHGAVTESHDDHRVAMALSVAGLAIDGETVIKDAECATVSFPGFFDVMRGVGADFTSK